MRPRIAVLLVASLGSVAACESTSGGGGSSGPKVAESGTARGSAGGFSTMMSAELARAGIGDPNVTPPAPAAATPPTAPVNATAGAAPAVGAAPGAAGAAPAAGAGTAPAAGAGTAPAAAGAAPTAGAGTASASAGAAPAGAGPATVAATGTAPAAGAAPATAAAPVPAAAPATAAAPVPAAASAPATATAAAPATAAATAPAAAAPANNNAKATGAIVAPANRPYVRPSADVAAIKLELEPNWERDMGEAGTFSLAVKVPGTNDTRLFSVRYGYEDQSAPVDCDAYRKFLEDKGLMKVTLNRQRGAACYVEGTDQAGVIAYRFLQTYGGKRLMCHGSLYKDAASLGDLRDKVLLQAKKICETLAL